MTFKSLSLIVLAILIPFRLLGPSGTFLYYDPINHDDCANEELSVQSPSQCMYAETYEEARTKFLQVTNKSASYIESLQVMDDLYIDIAVYEGSNKKKIIIHHSGIHGVEGFAGSAIQIAIALHLSSRFENRNTVVLVHGVNPFGMKHYRRVNENNVDLNRNALFEDDGYENIRNRDPNIAGYEDLNHILNPHGPPSWFNYFQWLKSIASFIFTLTPNCFARFRRSAITGTFTQKKGIFFGGWTLEKSHVLLRNFYERKGFLSNAERLIFIDVHTGLGEYARDTLMVGDEFHMDYVFNNTKNSRLFVDGPAPVAIERRSGNNEKVADASVGYDIVKGLSSNAYPKLFFNKNLKFCAMTQEFGTFHSMRIGYEAIMENQVYHFSTDEQERLNSGKRLKQMFSPSSQSFIERVVKRGLILFFQAFHTGIDEL